MNVGSIGARILEAMTQGQVAVLISTLFDLLDDKKKHRLLTTLDDEIAHAVSRILAPAEKPSQRSVTDSRYQQDWERLWSRWCDCTSELGDEEGKYVFQDRDWEPPEFDGGRFCGDLEEIAEEMLPLLDRIWELRIEDGEFFRDELTEIESSISGYPEWMGARHSECFLESCTTACLLKWEWYVAHSGKQPQKPSWIGWLRQRAS